MIEIQIDGQKYNVRLTDSVCASSLRKCLPVHSEFYMSYHIFYGELPMRLNMATAEETSSLHKGGVYYADRLQALAICLQERIQLNGIGFVRIGEIDDMANFPEKDSRFTLCEQEVL